MLNNILKNKASKITAQQKRDYYRFDKVNGKLVFAPHSGQYCYNELSAIDKMDAKVAYNNYLHGLNEVDERSAIRQFNHGN